MTTKIDEGTVIAGTMRDEDLIPAFMAVLEDHDEDTANGIREEYEEIFSYMDEGGYVGFHHDTHDARVNRISNSVHWLMDMLFNALDELAPDGMYFGAHPGDGSDYGYWRYEDEDDEPAPEDYVLYPSGPLGSRTSVSVVECYFLGEYRDHEDAIAAIKADMEKHNFYPNVWTCSDHGNFTLLEDF